MTEPTLYAVSIMPMDNIFAVPTRKDAIRIANLINLDIALDAPTDVTEMHPLVWASPVTWPFDYSLHDESMAVWGHNWLDWEIG